MNQLDIRQAAGCELVRSADIQKLGGPASEITLRGHYKVELVRDGKTIRTIEGKNGIVNEGKNKLLNVMFNGAAQIGTWYLGLIDLVGFSVLANDDIYDDINQVGNGWDEFANYNDAANASSTTTRPTWTEGAASGQSITNSAVVVFNVTGSGTVKGLFVAGGTNAQTKGDHTAAGNFLWATALFTGGDVAVTNGDQLKVTYTVSA